MTACAPLPVVTITVPLETRSELNQRGHWATRHRRTKLANELVFDTLALLSRPPNLDTRHALVTMTRVGGSHLDDDNRSGALKAVRDSVARWMGLRSDDHPHVRWRTTERAGAVLSVTVEVCVFDPGRSVAEVLSAMRAAVAGQPTVLRLVDELTVALQQAGAEGISL